MQRIYAYTKANDANFWFRGSLTAFSQEMTQDLVYCCTADQIQVDKPY